MLQYFFDDVCVLYTGNNLYAAATLLTLLYFYSEDPLQSLRPCDRVVEIGRLSAKTIHATHYLKFSVKITTNLLHYYFRKKVPYLEKEVSRFELGAEDLLI